MQRIHGWLDQLTLRRSRRRRSSQATERRNASVAPSCRLNSESTRRQLVPVNVPFVFPPPPTEDPPTLMTSSTCSRRSGIKTNPWLHLERPQVSHASTCSPPSAIFSLDRRRPPPSLGVKALDESTCSSGYGSQDCSPDSSVHLPSWSTHSPRDTWKSIRSQDEGFLEEHNSYTAYDNLCDEHIYHELELICRRPDRSYSSDCLSDPDSPTPQRESPIYAKPWSSRLPSNQQPLTVHNPSFKRSHSQPRRRLPERPESPIYATPYEAPLARIEDISHSYVYPGSFFSRLEQSRTQKYIQERSMPKSMEEAEEEFLLELDAQISELQQRSDELRNLVEKARVRRGPSQQWTRPILECTFELDL